MSDRSIPPPGSPPADPREARLVELEIKLAFAEDLLESLNAQVARQAERIEVLGRELLRLKSRVEQGGTGEGTPPGAVDERPPHY